MRSWSGYPFLAWVVGVLGCGAPPIHEPSDSGSSSDTSSESDEGPSEEDPRDAAEFYGLQVGARWTYLRPNGLHWKEITTCEDVYVPDPLTGEGQLVRAYVRVNRNEDGLTSVHYLIEDQAGVNRVRRDEFFGEQLGEFETYHPAMPRLYNDDTQTHTLNYTTGYFDPWTFTSRGSATTEVTHEALGTEPVTVIAGQFQARLVERRWETTEGVLFQGQVQSHYAPGVGEVAEFSELGWDEQEELVAYTPGYASCDGRAPLFATACDSPLRMCDNAWGAAGIGCTDPRVDPNNCGACGVICASGVCAGGACVESSCQDPCEGTTLCCPSAWGWAMSGCTSPARDAWNCGACGVVCGATQMCDRGQCRCPPGTEDCGDGLCRDVLDDPNHCGACGQVCADATPICEFGSCLECDAVGLLACKGGCVHADWDNANCGSCNNQCGNGNGTSFCSFGECLTCAEAGLLDCGGDCVDSEWSDKNCGACGNACASDETCVLGQCVAGDGSCPATCPDTNEICCEGECIDPSSNDLYCGACNVEPCAGGCADTCINAVCSNDCGDDAD